MASSRIKRELIEVEALEGVKVLEADDSNWRLTIDGPMGSYYEGMKFEVEVKLGQDYPFTVPRLKFNTEIVHPNVVDGVVTIPIWYSQNTISSILEELIRLMRCPEY